ncbi:hypothetical protein V1477_017522 [Vespula maculifrons]|uniref:C2 NT-type domain-containing protein n=1 Tax=Vespula maculifrons TaxID=7453 RepID=A0ABD2B688_VESMC
MPFVQTYMRSGDSRLRMTTTKSRLRPTYTVPGSVVRWTSTKTDNLSPRVDLEIFGLSTNFDNLSPRVDLEIFAGRHSSINEDLKHDRSCLEMFEADGVDSGAICKRGFIHLQFAEKPEAPEAERHLGSRILE